MADFIDFEQKEAAVALADTLNYDEAAKRLGITASELKRQIAALELKLSLHIFDAMSERPALTADGRILIEAIRAALRHKHR